MMDDSAIPKKPMYIIQVFLQTRHSLPSDPLTASWVCRFDDFTWWRRVPAVGLIGRCCWAELGELALRKLAHTDSKD